ncbi:MAG: DegT/DnrJ/EryC1/StrS aminotransferase family protein [Thermodesulfobacteriota bacterium]|jgi:dTDP-4-amino-4,6-dideoxygalactose transaminase|nr:MAG: DegT/DnrJ/EryC1/StrS aminotransferase family protein [Thermodesulfobacteriota bacterium]
MQENFLPFALPDIGEEEISEVTNCLRTGWLTTGPKTAQFEQAFSEYINVRYSLAVNSGTAGLHLALEATGVIPGDKIITTPYTFTATAEVIRYLGADPVFVDVELETFNIDPAQVERKIASLKAAGAKLKAIIPVHFGGQACEMDSILEIAGHHGLKVVEDAAHALPSSYRGRRIGTLGDATVFSFYATKPLVTGEGGMVVTNSEEIARRIKIMRLHGINRDVWDRYTSKKPNWYYEVVAPGFKYNMPDIMAAIGIHQLKKVERFQKRREEIARRYTEAFADLPLRTPQVVRPEDTHSWHLYVIKLELEKLTISRDEFIEKMAEKGIGTSVHFIPLHLHPYWRDRYKLKPDDYPNALHAYERAVSLPIYSRMTNADQSRVIDAVREVLRW